MPETEHGVWYPKDYREKLPIAVILPRRALESDPKPEAPEEKPVIYDQFDRRMIHDEPEAKPETEI